MKFIFLISIMVIYETSFAQSVFNNIINAPFFILKLSGTSADGLYRPRDLDFNTDSSRLNELWVINENSAVYDSAFGGSTCLLYTSPSPRD